MIRGPLVAELRSLKLERRQELREWIPKSKRDMHFTKELEARSVSANGIYDTDSRELVDSMEG